MKHLLFFSNYNLNENYHFEKTKSDKFEVEYQFETRKNIKIRVFFYPTFTNRIDKWCREYVPISEMGYKSYNKLNIHDTYNILSTVAEITAQFLLEYQPEYLEIEHIETEEEMQARHQRKEEITSTLTTKRSRINKRFLERLKVPGYSYTMIGYKSIFKKD